MSFTALNTCRVLAKDDFPEVLDVTKWVKEYMASANQRHSGAIERFVGERLSPEEQEAIAKYIR